MLASLASRPLAAFPVFRAGRLPHHSFRGLRSVHIVAARVVAEPPRAALVVGVLQPMSLPPSSAPTATGWSDSCRAGFAPAEEWHLVTAHQNPRLSDPRSPRVGGSQFGPELVAVGAGVDCRLSRFRAEGLRSSPGRGTRRAAAGEMR